MLRGALLYAYRILVWFRRGLWRCCAHGVLSLVPFYLRRFRYHLCSSGIMHRVEQLVLTLHQEEIWPIVLSLFLHCLLTQALIHQIHGSLFWHACVVSSSHPECSSWLGPGPDGSGVPCGSWPLRTPRLLHDACNDPSFLTEPPFSSKPTQHVSKQKSAQCDVYKELSLVLLRLCFCYSCLLFLSPVFSSKLSPRSFCTSPFVVFTGLATVCGRHVVGGSSSLLIH